VTKTGAILFSSIIAIKVYPFVEADAAFAEPTAKGTIPRNLEDARREREAERQFRLGMGDYPTECARCQRPLWDRTADEILAGAVLCAECGPPRWDLQWPRAG
jgi:hypothetical protein